MTTDTQPLAPTDAEIIAVMRDGYNCRYNDEADHIDFARAVLARWGRPAHSGEPVGYLYCGGSYGDELAEWEIVADQLQCDRLNEHHGALGQEVKLPIYTTPQSTQAVAPESAEFDQFLSDVLTAAGLVTHGKQCKALGERLADMCVKLRLHGIKGGKHDEQ